MGFITLGFSEFEEDLPPPTPILPHRDRDAESAPDRRGDPAVRLDRTPRAAGAERERGEVTE